MKLSLTNSPIGLIVPIDHAHHRCAEAQRRCAICSALTHERLVNEPMLREGAGRPATRLALAAFGRQWQTQR